MIPSRSFHHWRLICRSHFFHRITSILRSGTIFLSLNRALNSSQDHVQLCYWTELPARETSHLSILPGRLIDPQGSRACHNHAYDLRTIDHHKNPHCDSCIFRIRVSTYPPLQLWLSPSNDRYFGKLYLETVHFICFEMECWNAPSSTTQRLYLWFFFTGGLINFNKWYTLLRTLTTLSFVLHLNFL